MDKPTHKRHGNRVPQPPVRLVHDDRRRLRRQAQRRQQHLEFEQGGRHPGAASLVKGFHLLRCQDVSAQHVGTDRIIKPAGFDSRSGAGSRRQLPEPAHHGLIDEILKQEPGTPGAAIGFEAGMSFTEDRTGQDFGHETFALAVITLHQAGGNQFKITVLDRSQPAAIVQAVDNGIQHHPCLAERQAKTRPPQRGCLGRRRQGIIFTLQGEDLQTFTLFPAVRGQIEKIAPVVKRKPAKGAGQRETFGTGGPNERLGQSQAHGFAAGQRAHRLVQVGLQTKTRSRNRQIHSR
jgi:hypothetical protein